MMRSLVFASGSALWSALIPVMQCLVTTKLPDDVREIMFGARLVALEKAGGGLRPIGCGDVLRRAVGKAIAAQHKKQFAQLPLATRQVGVGVSAGADSVAHVTRRLLRAQSKSADFLVMKLDMANAFNSLSRSGMFEAVRATVPQLLPYVYNAYGNTTSLLFSSVWIESRCGVQQGDPLGPALFALTLAHAIRLSRPAPRLLASYPQLSLPLRNCSSSLPLRKKPLRTCNAACRQPSTKQIRRPSTLDLNRVTLRAYAAVRHWGRECTLTCRVK